MDESSENIVVPGRNIENLSLDVSISASLTTVAGSDKPVKRGVILKAMRLRIALLKSPVCACRTTRLSVERAGQSSHIKRVETCKS